MTRRLLGAIRERSILLILAALPAALALLWAYWSTLRGLALRWAEDPQYSHGFIVPIFAFLILWHRRGLLPTGRWEPAWSGMVLVILGAGLRLASAYFYLSALDGLSLLPTLAGICVLLGGLPLLRWAWPAIAFLIFMLPLPYQVETGLAHPLQRLATTTSTYALQTLGLPAVAQGNIILIDHTKLGVLGACSGLGMLMTFFALSTAVAFLIQRPARDKIVVFLSAAPIGVLVNLIRITVTGVLFCTVGSYWANLVFHDLAGWLMMPLALFLLWLELLFLKHLWTRLETGPVPLLMPGRAGADVPAPTPLRQPETTVEHKSEQSLLEIL